MSQFKPVKFYVQTKLISFQANLNDKSIVGRNRRGLGPGFGAGTGSVISIATVIHI